MIRRPRRPLVPCLCCVLLLSGLVLAQSGTPQVPPDLLGEEHLMAAMHSISSHALFDYVKTLASPAYQGRLTGTPGFEAAARWVTDLLASWRIQPAGDQGTYYQRFPDPYTLVLPGASLSLDVPLPGGGTIRRPYVFEDDFFPGSTSASGTVTAQVIYVGYGITAPELGYDDYQGMDVKGRLVMMEPEVPVRPDTDPELFRKWRPYSFHDYKERNAAAHGASGILYNYHITNPNGAHIEGLGLMNVGRSVWTDVFAGTGRTRESVLETIRRTLKPASFATGKTITMTNVTEHHPEGIGANVIGWLPGSDPVLRQEAIVIGAHLDHLGLNPVLMPGAHDNASGVAVMLGVAEALATSRVPLKRSVVFIAFGAEEQGVKGSEFYVGHPFVANERTTAMLNLESVGRGEVIDAGAARNFPKIWETIDTLNRKYIHRPVVPTANANLARPRQDAAHFLWAGVPTVSFGTGGATPLPYATYHTTKDTPELITPEIMEDLARLVFLTTVELANK